MKKSDGIWNLVQLLFLFDLRTKFLPESGFEIISPLIKSPGSFKRRSLPTKILPSARWAVNDLSLQLGFLGSGRLWDFSPSSDPPLPTRPTLTPPPASEGGCWQPDVFNGLINSMKPQSKRRSACDTRGFDTAN